MARNRQVFVNREKKKPSAAVPALVIIGVALLVAFVGAYAWQTISGDGLKLAEKEAMSSAATEPPKLESSTPESSTPEESASPPAPESTEPESEAQPENSNAYNPVATVPKGERVSSSYFDDALFVGDSITNGILSYEIMQNTTVISHTGINPDTIRTKKVFRDSGGELVTILDAMKEHTDKTKIYIMLGSNGIAWIEQDLFIQYYEEFLRSVMAQHPDATIYVQSILPVTKEKSESDAAYANSKIDAYNNDISALAQKLELNYINVAEAFKDENGALPSEASPSDGMHFTSKYYQMWFDYLKTHTVA